MLGTSGGWCYKFFGGIKKTSRSALTTVMAHLHGFCLNLVFFPGSKSSASRSLKLKGDAMANIDSLFAKITQVGGFGGTMLCAPEYILKQAN